MNRELHDKALAWLDGDPDPVTREQLQAIMDDEDALAEAFAGPLQFGTAGLRGEIGPGESRMNQAVVIRATYGLVQWLLRQVERPRVVIGCDARHGSFTFAEAAAEVVAAAGGEALLLPLGQPTPLTSFSVRHLDADAGIMVTASHNPAKDNGYKVYLGGRIATGDAAGVQIVPPADKEIAACIAEAPAAASIARSAHFELVDTREAYRAATAPLGKPAGDLKIVLTPMHGVGGQLALDTLKDAGFGDVTVVEKQFEPDPDFPTVAFPNPEEDGALDLAVATAVDVDADLIIALDPDADRCALAVPARMGPAPERRWRRVGSSFLATRPVRSSVTTSLGPAARAYLRRPSSPGVCSPKLRVHMGTALPPRSQASSGSAALLAWCTAMRKPSATASTRSTCAIRMVSLRLWWLLRWSAR